MPYCPALEGLSRMDRLQNAVPVAKGPGFLQLSVQLQGVLQPKTPSQKALYYNIKRGAKTMPDFLRPLLCRNHYCNEGCKTSATVRCQFIVLQRVNVLILREESPKGKTHAKEKRQTETARFGPISGQMVSPRLISYPPTNSRKDYM